MKLRFALLTAAVAIFFSACNGGDKEAGGLKTEYAAVSNNDANEIIAYNNVLVKFSDNNNNYVRSITEKLSIIAKGLENQNHTYGFTFANPPFFTPIINSSKYKPETPPAVINSNDQKYFKDNITGIRETITKIKETYEALYNYLMAEDWKDDKTAKGKQFVDSIYSMSETYYKYDDNIITKLDAIGDDAEKVILKKHPLKEYVFALKDDRKSVDNFNKLIMDHANNYKAGEEKIKVAYLALEIQNKKHTEMDAPNGTKFSGKDAAFKYFNESVNDYLAAARRAMRNAATTGKLNKSDTEDLVTKYDYIRTGYNNFVD